MLYALIIFWVNLHITIKELLCVPPGPLRYLAFTPPPGKGHRGTTYSHRRIHRDATYLEFVVGLAYHTLLENVVKIYNNMS